MAVADTICFLSGGSLNGDPLLSLGGSASFVEASANLFDDFEAEESELGLEDYRCIYVSNALTSSLLGLQVWIESPTLSSATMILGIDESNDVQEVNLEFFSGIGSFTLDFNGTDVVVLADSDLNTFAQNFQNALRNTFLTDVTVVVQLLGIIVNFTVSFIGVDGKREQPVFALKDNSLAGSPPITITKTVIGSPINATAEIVATDITPPINPEFRITTGSLPIFVPLLNENEGFPLWIKRTIPENPTPSQNDGFFLKIFAIA